MSSGTNLHRTRDLLDTENASEFYDDRYSRDYMRDWPRRTKRRLHQVVRDLAEHTPLPSKGRALDFGCGRGVLTEVLRDALPGWDIFGTDLSDVALGMARSRVRGCTFVNGDDPALFEKPFDFVFSHHVLEHVSALQPAFTAFSQWVRPGGAMLHVLPCGNAGSLEHSVAFACRDGIDPLLGNRFFYEDPGHVRRLTSGELNEELSAYGFTPLLTQFNNHYHGAIEWMTAGNIGFLVDILNPSRAQSEEGMSFLRRLRRKLGALAILRWPAIRLRSLRGQGLSFSSETLQAVAVLPTLPLSLPVDLVCRRRAAREWQLRRSDPSGSEMFAAYRRVAPTEQSRL